MRDDTIEAACVVAMALAWATVTALRLLLVPMVALLLVLLTPPRRPAPEAAPAAPEAAVSLASLAAELQALPAAELRVMAGTRRRLPKRELTALICAMPI